MKLSLPAHRYRRLTGLVLGGGLGLVYGLVSQLINRALLPGVPLYQPPFGPAGNSALSMIGGALLGLICAWPLTGVLGVFWASAVTAVALLTFTFVKARLSGNQLIAMLLTGVFLALPFWGMLVPLIAALRWGVNGQEEAHRDRLPRRARVFRPVLLIALAAGAGALSLKHADVRLMLNRTHALLQAGQQAADDALPAPLQQPDVGAFSQRGRGPYQLAWEGERIARYRIPRPGRNFDTHSVVVAHFASGWHLVCLYIAPDEPPLCKGFDQLPP